ncbi:MAG: hypothetical protein A2Y33_00325 [Spirochaetes bacterium GWF1_51_8]|nr:MAG: hypothetical protein A2Y33_00325 [Spirochaetes bacterium GWF1_51_8]
MKIQSGITSKFLFFMTLSLLFIVFVVQIPAIIIFHDRNYNKIMSDFHSSITVPQAVKIDSLLNERLTLLKICSESKEILSFFRDPSAANTKAAFEAISSISGPYSMNSLLVNDKTREIFIDGQSGGILDPSIESDRWYFKLKETNFQQVIFTDWFQILKYPYVWLIRIVGRPETGFGILGYGIELGEFLDRIEIEDGQFDGLPGGDDFLDMAIVNSDGTIRIKKGMMFYEGETFYKDMHIASAPPWQDWSRFQPVYKNDQKYFYSATLLKSTVKLPSQWYLINGASDDFLFGSLRTRIVLYCAGLVLVFAILIILSGTMVSRNITSRLNKLADAADAVASNNLDTEIIADRPDEIGRLAGKISVMRDHLREVRNHMSEIIDARTEELQFALSQLERKDELARHEFSFAASIQKGLIPPHLTWKDLTVTSFVRQMEGIGGDTIDIVVKPDQLVTYLADISGHGIPASMITMLTKISFLYAIQNKQSIIDIMQEVNHKIHDLINRQEIKYINYFTAFVVVFHPDLSFDYISAGHIPAILFRKSSKSCQLISSSSSMIGVFDTQIVKFSYKSDKLERGDKILIFSDGFVNTRNNAGKKFGMEHLVEFTREWSGVSAEEFLQLVVEDFERHRADRQLEDDVSILIVERKM